jgi:hypothetical protein
MRTIALAAGLLAVAGLVRADDDPEPPNSGARQLLGKWQSYKRLSGGGEGAFTTTSYDFAKGKVTCQYGSKQKITTQERTFQIDRKRGAILMTYNGMTRRHFYKFEKGELLLTIDRSNDSDAKPDFTGKTSVVLILKKEK